MGQAGSRTLYVKGLKRMLASRGAKVGKDQLERFLAFVETVCPWFPEGGTVNIQTWVKVGERLQDYYTVHGPLKVPVETFGLWTLIRDCLDLRHEQFKIETLKNCQEEDTSLAKPETQKEEVIRSASEWGIEGLKESPPEPLCHKPHGEEDGEPSMSGLIPPPRPP